MHRGDDPQEHFTECLNPASQGCAPGEERIARTFLQPGHETSPFRDVTGLVIPKVRKAQGPSICEDDSTATAEVVEDGSVLAASVLQRDGVLSTLSPVADALMCKSNTASSASYCVSEFQQALEFVNSARGKELCNLGTSSVSGLIAAQISKCAQRERQSILMALQEMFTTEGVIAADDIPKLSSKLNEM